MTQRPDLFAVALPAVGVMDMLRYHRFTGGAAWAGEYGSADEPAAFAYLRRYSPLQNLKPGTCYPATLVTTADHDDRVVPSHSYKFAAALQAAQGCPKPVLLRVETQGSHGYRATDKQIAEQADLMAFVAQQLGLTPPAAWTKGARPVSIAPRTDRPALRALAGTRPRVLAGPRRTRLPGSGPPPEGGGSPPGPQRRCPARPPRHRRATTTTSTSMRSSSARTTST